MRYNLTQALQAGLEVTIHEKPITQDGWSGAGYIAIDPSTGAGGYLIEGGSNGSWIPVEAIGLTMILIVLPLGVALMTSGIGWAAGFALIFGVYRAMTGYIDAINKVIENPDLTPEQKNAYVNTLSLLTAFASCLSALFAASASQVMKAAAGVISALSSLFIQVVDFLQDVVPPVVQDD